MARLLRLLAPAALALALVPPVQAAVATPRTSGGEPIRLDLEAPTNLSSTGVTLRGDVHNDFDAVRLRFEYGAANAFTEGSQPVNVFSHRFEIAQAVTGLLPNTTYVYRLAARPYNDPYDTTTRYSATGSFTTGPGGGEATPPAASTPPPTTTTPPATAGPDATSAPAAPAPAPTPEAGRSVAVAPAKGTVLVRRPGSTGYVALAAGSAIPMGSVLDTRKGEVALTSKLPSGKTQTGTFNGGRFLVRQSRDGTVDLYLRGPVCPPRTSGRASLSRGVFAGVAARRASRRSGRKLFGRDKGGKFRTHGRNSHATVRGTRWLVEDRCDGTLTKVTEGAVLVKNLKTKRRTLVKAGGHYLARAKR